MERQRVIERERWAEFKKEDVPEYHLKRDEERKHLFSLPRVIKPHFRHGGEGREVPHLGRDTADREEETAGGFTWRVNKWREMGYPIYTMNPHIKRGRPKPGRWGGGHRHFFEAVYYVSGGNGREEQDGVTYEWGGEGLLCVPTFAVHRHYTDVPGDPDLDEIRFCVKSYLYEQLGICDYEFYDISRRALEAMGGKVPQWYGTRNEWLENIMSARRAVTRWKGGKPKTVYDRYLKELVDENHWYRNTRRFIPCAEVPWEDTRQGRIKWMIHPGTECCIRTLDIYIQELPPGSRSGKHRHVGEELIYVLEGKGYDIHDGERYDWEAGDLVCVPVLTAHQHFNADCERPAKFISNMTRWYSMLGCGGIEQLEDAPEYKDE